MSLSCAHYCFLCDYLFIYKRSYLYFMAGIGLVFQLLVSFFSNKFSWRDGELVPLRFSKKNIEMNCSGVHMVT